MSDDLEAKAKEAFFRELDERWEQRLRAQRALLDAKLAVAEAERRAEERAANAPSWLWHLTQSAALATLLMFLLFVAMLLAGMAVNSGIHPLLVNGFMGLVFLGFAAVLAAGAIEEK